jgi:5'-nucleotidase/UDP-sugar diphosphatase
MRSTLALFLVSMSLNAALAADLTGLETPLPLKQGESVLTIIGTNDVHGGVDPAFRFGKRLGGYDWFAGCVNAVRAHSRKTYGETGQVIMLDAGDAAQGALTSNYSEGLLMASLMNQVGYNAAIPGNHAYDFGPVGWLDDTVPAGKQGDPLGALRRFVRALSFPMLSANVYTLDDQHLPELPPYTLISTFGRRNIAVIGLESPNTPETTMAENVKGLKFTPGVKELQEIVETLTKAGKADVFIAVMHHGDGSDKGMESFLKALPRRSTGEPLIDIMIAGHTHYVNDNVSGEIPYVQSGSNGRLFGLVQCVLVQDPKTRRLHVDRARTRKKGGPPCWGNR